MKIVVTKEVRKKLPKIPPHVRKKLKLRSDSVLEVGLEEVRLIPGYHDEPLRGNKEGHRSIRLNKQWRAEYVVSKNEDLIIAIIEVHPHDY